MKLVCYNNNNNNNKLHFGDKSIFVDTIIHSCNTSLCIMHRLLKWYYDIGSTAEIMLATVSEFKKLTMCNNEANIMYY